MDKKIRVCGSKVDIAKAKEALEKLELSSKEGEARLQIQKLVDREKLKASILYDENTVWSKDRIIRNLREILNAGVLGYNSRYIPIGSILRLPVEGKPVLSHYFYEFLSLDCGSIAHYDIHGWIAEYPTVQDLKQFFQRNEFGSRVRDHLPEWHTDAIAIVEEIEKLLNNYSVQVVFPLAH